MMKLKINTEKTAYISFIGSRPFYNVSIFRVRLLRCNLFLRKSNINGIYTQYIVVFKGCK